MRSKVLIISGLLILAALLGGCKMNGNSFSYTVKFDANGGGGEMKNQTMTLGVSQLLRANTFTASEGSDLYFAGWATTKDGKVVYKDEANVKNLATTSITLYARWGYRVTFNTDGGSVINAVTVLPGDTVPRPSADPGKDGNTFVYWYFDDINTQWDFANQTVSNNMELTALWYSGSGSGTTFTVQFISNGGNSVQIQNVANGGMITPVTPVKSGYVFDAWYSDSSFLVQWKFATDTVSGNMTLYARWWNNVDFSADSGTPAPQQQTVLSGDKVTEPPAMSKAGYAFKGWYTTNTFETLWVFGTNTVNSHMTLYAKWDPIPVGHYLVSFFAQGAVSQPIDETVEDGETVPQPDNPASAQDGWIFDKWYRDGTTTPWDFANDTVTGDITLKGNFIQLPSGQYVVRFVTNGGSPVPADQAVSANGKAAEPSPVMSKTNEQTGEPCTFGGWYSDADCTVPWIFADYPVNGTTVLYAKWNQQNFYTVNFITNCSIPAPLQQTVPRFTTVKDPGALQRTGYTFDGWYWYYAPGVLSQWIFTSNAPDANTFLYAQWTPISYTVKYDRNSTDATGSMSDVPCTYDEDLTIAANAFTRTGYTFIGWNTLLDGDKTGQGTHYTAGQPVRNLSVTNGATVTLYAQWSINSYTVTFNTNGGTPVPPVQTVTYGSTATEPVNPVPVLDNYTLIHWYSAPGLGPIYLFDTPVTADLTLYAGWMPDSFSITFAQITDAAPSITGPTIYRSSTNGPVTATITVDNPGQYSSIEWYISRTDISGSGSSFTLNAVNSAYNNTGQHFLTVEVIKDGVPYNRTITFTVNP